MHTMLTYICTLTENENQLYHFLERQEGKLGACITFAASSPASAVSEPVVTHVLVSPSHSREEEEDASFMELS